MIIPTWLLAVLAGAEPPSPPSITFPDPLNVTAMVEWWSSSTFGLFTALLGPLVVASVYLKTRSLAATGVSAIVVASLYTGKWILMVAALALAGLLYGAWRRSAEE